MFFENFINCHTVNKVAFSCGLDESGDGYVDESAHVSDKKKKNPTGLYPQAVI